MLDEELNNIPFTRSLAVRAWCSPRSKKLLTTEGSLEGSTAFALRLYQTQRIIAQAEHLWGRERGPSRSPQLDPAAEGASLQLEISRWCRQVDGDKDTYPKPTV